MKLPNNLVSTLQRLDLDAVAGWLGRIHRNSQQHRRADQVGETGGSYETARQALRDRETRLKNERAVVDEALATLVGQPPAPAAVAQQELAVLGEAGSKAAGRFRLRNTLARPARFHFQVGCREDGSAAAPIEFLPADLTLGPLTARLVRLEIDLSHEPAGSSWSTPVHVCEGQRVRQRLWLVVHCVTPA